MRKKRQGIIIWFQHRRNIRQIKKFGHLVYVSMKMRYALIYVNQEEIEDIEKRLLKFSFVSKIDRSYKPFVATTYDNPTPDQAKIYDYKMGI